MNEIALNYAQAFLDIAIEHDKIDQYKKELDDIINIFDSIDNIKSFFSNVLISKEEKKQLIEASFGNKIDKYTLNFLKLLVDKGRIDMYKEIFVSYHSLANDTLGIKEGVIESARPLTKEQIKKIEDSLGNNVELKGRINKSLISGFKIIFDNKIIDYSLKDKIDELSEMLLERS